METKPLGLLSYYLIIIKTIWWHIIGIADIGNDATWSE